MERAPKPIPSDGPKVTIRFRSQKEIDMVKKAAESLNFTANLFMVEALVEQANEVVQSQKAQ